MSPLKLSDVALAIVMVLVRDALSSYCDTNWIYKAGRCYRYYGASSSGISPNSARSACQGMSAMLASFDNQEQLNFLISLRTGDINTYLGARDEKIDALWLWADGKPAIFTPMASGEPNNATEGCMVIIGEAGTPNRADLVGDIGCGNARVDTGYLCQKLSNIPAIKKMTNFKLRVSGKKTGKSFLASHAVSSLTECAVICANNDGCLSVNVCDGGTVCEVVDADLADSVVTNVACDVYYVETQDLE